MTSTKKSLKKILLISLLITTSIGLSVASVIAQGQASENIIYPRNTIAKSAIDIPVTIDKET